MSWTTVARKDFQDARRSRVLWALSAVFLVLAVLVAGLYAFVPAITAEPEVSTVGLLGFLASPVTLFVAVGLVVMLAVVFAGGVPFSPADYAVFVVVTLFFALAYVAVFVGVSAMTTSTTRAATISVLLLVVFEVAWDIVPLGAWFVASGFQVPGGFLAGNFGARPDWVAFLFQLPPSGAGQSHLIFGSEHLQKIVRIPGGFFPLDLDSD